MLKVKLTSAPALAYPSFDKPFVVCTDASSKAVGAVLSQADKDGRDRSIHNASRALYPEQSNCSMFKEKHLTLFPHLKIFSIT